MHMIIVMAGAFDPGLLRQEQQGRRQLAEVCIKAVQHSIRELSGRTAGSSISICRVKQRQSPDSVLRLMQFIILVQQSKEQGSRLNVRLTIQPCLRPVLK